MIYHSYDNEFCALQHTFFRSKLQCKQNQKVIYISICGTQNVRSTLRRRKQQANLVSYFLKRLSSSVGKHTRGRIFLHMDYGNCHANRNSMEMKWILWDLHSAPHLKIKCLTSCRWNISINNNNQMPAPACNIWLINLRTNRKNK